MARWLDSWIAGWLAGWLGNNGNYKLLFALHFTRTKRATDDNNSSTKAKGPSRKKLNTRESQMQMKMKIHRPQRSKREEMLQIFSTLAADACACLVICTYPTAYAMLCYKFHKFFIMWIQNGPLVYATLLINQPSRNNRDRWIILYTHMPR